MLRLVSLVVAVAVAACIPMTGAQEARINQLCGDPRAAYEHGYNKGLERAPMNTAWIDMYCVPQTREQQRQAYVSGYQNGVQQTPAPLVNIGGYGYGFGYVAPQPQPQPQCLVGADGMNSCGYNCRMGGDGHQYCSSVPDGRCALNADGTMSCP
jgi:hypothetical protein